ncbi:hypothetical protein NP493_1356g00012 [Ridgeia piscesae]|uniref:Uncharacterized protein n=1 Tax=Ridgeia piscesae TaxID=27915 RepID=A0AAD9K743_RIDPI|nr:hypothetical protein NP493_1356g00012 [Ridgeia piscesae]
MAAPSLQSKKTSNDATRHQPLKLPTRQAKAGALGRKPKTVLLTNKDAAGAKVAAERRQQVPQNATVASASDTLTPAVKTKKSKTRHVPASLQSKAIGSLTLDSDTDLLDSLLDLPRPLSPLPLSPTQRETVSTRFFPELDDNIPGKTTTASHTQAADGHQTVQDKASASGGKQQKKAGKRCKTQSDTNIPAKKGVM